MKQHIISFEITCFNWNGILIEISHHFIINNMIFKFCFQYMELTCSLFYGNCNFSNKFFNINFILRPFWVFFFFQIENSDLFRFSMKLSIYILLKNFTFLLFNCTNHREVLWPQIIHMIILSKFRSFAKEIS